MIPTLLTVAISASVACTNANWLHSERCTAPVKEFTVTDHGETFGFLESGVQFSQTNIINNVTRLQRFQVEQAYWYVSDRGDIQADTDTQALSIYLAV